MIKHTELYNSKSKKSGMSIAYAIILLIVVGVAIAGLTPVLTRKLPNLATSSTIKHPKGWYESYNAPKEGVKYCKKNCKDKDEAGQPWDTPEYTTEIKEGEYPPNGCYGNPACLPYIDPNTPPAKIIAFERYCKGNGKCLPPVPCKDGKCQFTPPDGVTKFEVYAIGGGGGSGSAVARNRDKEFLWSKMPGYKKSAGGRNNHSGTDKYDEYTPAILPRGSDAGYNVLPDPDSIVGAHFIDLNRKDTASAGYTPEDFVYENGHERDEQHPYPNRLKSTIINKCATGILYTVGDSSRNFHIYPTEDADERLSKNVSDKQIKRILKEHGESQDKKYGSFNFYYYNRYYLFTHQLGVYSYNQNPVYSLMPEWVILKPDDKKYPVDTDFREYVDGTNTSTYCTNKNCNINYYSSGECGSIKNGSTIPIISKYKTVAAVACSGDGGSGGNATCSRALVCDWMIPSACYYDDNDLSYKEVESKTYNKGCNDTCGTALPPKDNVVGEYCYRGTSYTKTEYQDVDINGNKKTYFQCEKKHCHHNNYFINRQCVYKLYVGPFANCSCENKPLFPSCVKNQDSVEKCAPNTVSTNHNPNVDADKKNIRRSMNNNATDAIGTDFALYDDNGNEAKYRIERDGSIYDVTNPSQPRKAGKISAAVDKDGNGNYKFIKTDTYDPVTEAAKILNKDFEKTYQKNEKIKDKTAELLNNVGGGTPVCTATNPYTRSAYGGAKGNGICTYKIASVKPNTVKSIYTDPSKGYTDNMGKAATAGCDGQNDGSKAGDAKACINGNCSTAEGGDGGTGALVNSNLCPESAAQNGKKGKNGGVSNGGEFPKGQKGNSALKYTSSAYLGTSNDDKYQSPNVIDGANITGTQKQPGIYNFRYIWYMPFVTKHLLFGTSGDAGEELITTITLSRGQTLDVTPGIGAAMTNYKSGENGANGGDSTVVNNDAKVNLVARGGKGGVGSQKTDEYVLCHISDLQGVSPELPCYAKRINGKLVTNYKKTHYYDTKEHKYKGIQAIMPKTAKIGKSLKMSESLKQSNPGAGAMGFGTESVSDFVCEERHVDKLDQVNGSYSRINIIRSSGIKQDNTIDEKCNGNSRIRYILPNAKDYTSSTGAVIIVW